MLWGALMISPCQTKDNKIICNNYSSALGTLKEKLYNGNYYTSANSSVCVAYTRRNHRYQAFSSQDNSISTNENPRSKENYDTIRILEIPTSSDDFDKYIESQMELAKLIMVWRCCQYMLNNINFITSLNIRMNKEERNEGQDINNKETKKLRTLILSTNVNDYDTGE